MTDDSYSQNICMYLPKLSVRGRMQNKVNFEVKYSWFEFRVFLQLDQLLIKGLRAQSTVLIYP